MGVAASRGSLCTGEAPLRRVVLRGEAQMLSCRAVVATHAVEAAEVVEHQQPRGRATAESVRGKECEPRRGCCERVGSGVSVSGASVEVSMS